MNRENSFQSSQVYLHGRKQKSTERTSQTAGLPRDELVVQCVTARARRFLGTAFTEGKDDIGILQLVKYKAGQRFDLHHDWYDRPQVMNGRRFNRIASFFAFLHANCTDGETHFPYLKPLQDVKSKDAIDHEGKFRLHEKGGVAFKPIRGNALFWMNLAANGTGDKRVMHAGLPVTDGTKIAMNIWPRKFYD